ncbi:MAG TPA: glycosyltransferase family 4 protein [Candidatus Binatus sp.]|nr:glycosyltransferase family 4 protein [Candidatus Binatus sp.]
MRHFGRSVDAIIPNGVDLNFFSHESACPVDLEALGIRWPFVVFAAHLEARKRPDIFIEISKLLPELDFVMLGGYSNVEERDSYLALVRERPNVRYLGLQPRSILRDLYAGAAALVFPSEIEGLALAVVEAQAMGLPVLAQPKTCMPELIEDGNTGWLLPSKNLDMWGRKLRDILAWSTSERTAYTAKTRALTKERYSWDVIAPLYREMYLVAAKR